MPLLSPEPSVSPGTLFDDVLESVGEARWRVLHTRPRAEKALARRLASRGVSFFLPQHPRTWRHRGRLLTSYVPLFAGYVFLHGDSHARMQALETNLVAGVLEVVDQEALHKDLVQVHSLIASGLPLTPEDRLQKGQWVELISGPFAGMEGRILHRQKLRFVVEVRFLQQGVSVDLEGWMIRPSSRDRSMAVSA